MADATNSFAAALPPLELLQGAALFLDFDGTLVELAERPDAIELDDRLLALLSRLGEALDGRIALVSGRPVEQLRLFVPLPLTIVGGHGLEFGTADGGLSLPARPAALAEVLTEMAALAGRCQGVVVEEKPVGAALHFRQAPEWGDECEALAASLAARHGLHFQPGKMMAEVRMGGSDKGTAIAQLMREPGMAGARPIFMGDDLTDEPGFSAVADFGGEGILVGPPRTSAARYRLPGVQAALDWLQAAAEHLR